MVCVLVLGNSWGMQGIGDDAMTQLRNADEVIDCFYPTTQILHTYYNQDQTY